MKSKKLLIPFAVFASFGLTACGANNNATGGTEDANITQPLGYYSNENHGNNGGNANILDGNDNDGPVTEMMDRSFGENNNRSTDVTNVRNNTANFDGNYNQSDNYTMDVNRNGGTTSGGFATSPTNYEGNYNQGDNRSNTRNMNNGTRNKANMENTVDTTRNNLENEDNISSNVGRAAAKVDNVHDVRAITYGDTVLIALDLQNDEDASKIVRKVQSAVKPYLKGRTAKVVTNQRDFSRVRNMDDAIRNGASSRDLSNLFRTIDSAPTKQNR